MPARPASFALRIYALPLSTDKIAFIAVSPSNSGQAQAKNSKLFQTWTEKSIVWWNDLANSPQSSWTRRLLHETGQSLLDKIPEEGVAKHERATIEVHLSNMVLYFVRTERFLKSLDTKATKVRFFPIPPIRASLLIRHCELTGQPPTSSLLQI